MIADPYVDRCMDVIRQKMEDETIGVTTIAITPSDNFTGGWDQSEAMMEYVLARLGINFSLRSRF